MGVRQRAEQFCGPRGHLLFVAAVAVLTDSCLRMYGEREACSRETLRKL